ncbi:MAG: hypothetical protein LBC26_07560, partial [Oscillospiraceae bacterium]|nr:hypothetical protein [Oscillospiraceae bacterium]
KRLFGGVSADAVAVLLVVSACRTLDMDELEFFRLEDLEDLEELEPDDENHGDSQDVPDEGTIHTPALPQAEFFIQGSFDYAIHRGSYQLLMEFGEHKKYFAEENLDGQSDVTMILLAVIIGLEKLRVPCAVTVYSNTLFGLTSIYNKNGHLREAVPPKTANYELKKQIRLLLEEKGHVLYNFDDNALREYIGRYREEAAAEPNGGAL